MDFLSLSLVDQLTAIVVLATVAVAVITDKLVWHTRLKASQARADRWETIALEALRTGAQAGVQAAETTAAIVSAMPNPGTDDEEVPR